GHGEELTNWRNSEFNADPPAGWQIVEVPYHDGVFPGIDEKPLDEAVADGVGKLDAAVRDFHARCLAPGWCWPGTPRAPSWPATCWSGWREATTSRTS